MMKRRMDFLKPINLGDDLWCYADDRCLEIVRYGPHRPEIFKLTWKRLDRLRKQAAEARARGDYKP